MISASASFVTSWDIPVIPVLKSLGLAPLIINLDIVGLVKAFATAHGANIIPPVDTGSIVPVTPNPAAPNCVNAPACFN